MTLRSETSNTEGVVGDAEGLVDLLHALNEQGRWPTAAFLDARGIAGLAYGIDQGDEMGIAFITDPGEDRGREDGSEDGASYINIFERDVHELRGPIKVLYAAEG